jgi:diadenosine tetraphosphate (Ap4A) HIT family hydrolase
MKNGHSFQTKFATEAYAQSRELWDTPLFESRSFVAIPTVGALVEGWLLVVPKTAALSFARLSTGQLSELGEFLDEIVPFIESAYGPVSVFEHGPAIANSSVGCGVDYAHLHLVPTRCDLLAGAREIAPNVRWDQIRSFDEIHESTSLV